MQTAYLHTIDNKIIDKVELANVRYTDATIHPSEVDFYNGVILAHEGKRKVVCRSFQWSQILISNIVPDEYSSRVISRRYEGPLLRFYRFHGVPMISTHTRIDIAGTKSRIGNGKPFFDLLQEAINNWNTVDEVQDIEGVKTRVFTPKKWEDLCVEGRVNVFILTDSSVSTTNINDLTMSGEYIDSTLNGPKLMHCLSLLNSKEDLEPVFPKDLPHVPVDKCPSYSAIKYIYPTVEYLSVEEANKFLSIGGAVVTFDVNMPDKTTSLLSVEYNNKLYLTEDEFNRVLRWCSVMDNNPAEENAYFGALPLKIVSNMTPNPQEYMRSKLASFDDKTLTYLTVKFNNQLKNVYSPLSKGVYDILGPEFRNNLMQKVSKLDKKNQITPAKLRQYLSESISVFPYLSRHKLHSQVMKEENKNNPTHIKARAQQKNK